MFTEYRFNNPEVTKAFTDLELAKNLFNQANTPNTIDAAIYELTAAEFHLRAALKRARDNKNGPVMATVADFRQTRADKPNPPPAPPMFRLRP